MNKDSNIALNLHKQILIHKEIISDNFFMLGECLVKMQEEKLYRIFDCNTFEEYLGMPELGFGRAWAYRLMELYRTFHRKLNIPKEKLKNLSPSKLSVILPVINNDNKETLLEQAKILSTSDLTLERKKYRGVSKEILVTLTSQQVYELFLFIKGSDKTINIEKILNYKKFNLFKTEYDWEWEAEEQEEQHNEK